MNCKVKLTISITHRDDEKYEQNMLDPIPGPLPRVDYTTRTGTAELEMPFAPTAGLYLGDTGAVQIYSVHYIGSAGDTSYFTAECSPVELGIYNAENVDQIVKIVEEACTWINWKFGEPEKS